MLMKRNGSGSRSEAQFFFSLQRCCCCFFFQWCCSGREKQVSKKTKIPSSVGAFVFFLPLFQKSFPSLFSVHSSLVQLSKGSPAFVPSSVSFSVYFFFCAFLSLLPPVSIVSPSVLSSCVSFLLLSLSFKLSLPFQFQKSPLSSLQNPPLLCFFFVFPSSLCCVGCYL